jgi:hypothetical protein
MRTVGSQDGGAHVSADLCSAQHAWPAGTRLLLQRGRRAIPALMPALHCPRAAIDCMSSSECSEGASGVMWRVVEEDVVLGLGAEVRHGCVESGRAE